MIQDLNDLAVLGRNNKELLGKINFDLGKLDQSAELSDMLAGVLARSNGEKLEGSEVLEMRNKAYTYLKLAVDEVRDYGKYVFRKDDEKRQGYRSEYLRKKNQRNR
jgi:hypothetical protein